LVLVIGVHQCVFIFDAIEQYKNLLTIEPSNAKNLFYLLA